MGINQNKMDQAVQQANRYGLIQNGQIVGNSVVAKKIIDENGGDSMLDKCLSYAKNPFVKAGLKKLNVDDDMINNMATELKGANNASSVSNNPTIPNTSSSISGRLSKLN